MSIDFSFYGIVEKPMIGIIIALLVVVATYNWQVGLLATIIAIAILAFIGHRAKKRRDRLTEYLETMASNMEQTTHYALQNLPLAIAIVDNLSNVRWSNSVFNDWIGIDAGKTQRIKGMSIALRLDKLWGKSGYFTDTIDGKTYRIYHKFIEAPADQKASPEDVNGHARRGYMAFYYNDISETVKACKAAENAMPVFAYIQIDNFDDVAKGMSDIDYTNLWAEVNNIIVNEIDQVDGFIRSYADESYVACISREALQSMINDNFPILDKVRNIHTPRKIPLTISMGIASEEPSMKVISERARAGLDLALGRGGDQATVYTGEDVKFYGGRTTGSEKNTRVRARVVAQAIKELVNDASNVIIMGHEREDYDSIGGAIGVSAMVKSDGIPVKVVISKQTQAIENLREFITENKDMEDLLITPEEAEGLVTDNTLVFVVDVHRPDMVAAPKALEKAKKRVVIDHHRRSTEFVEKPLITYLEPASSSTSELVTELIQYYGDHVELNDIEASVLYAGIVVDTKNFIVQTGSRTFDAASYLRRSGANLDVVRQLFRETFQTARCRAKILSQSEVHGDLAFAVCPEGTENGSVVCAQTADLLITIEGVEASFVFYYREDGNIGVSARSQGKYNVQVIMESLGGGGHRTVAGGKLSGMTMDEAKEKALEAAKRYKETLKKTKEEE